MATTSLILAWLPVSHRTVTVITHNVPRKMSNRRMSPRNPYRPCMGSYKIRQVGRISPKAVDICNFPGFAPHLGREHPKSTLVHVESPDYSRGLHSMSVLVSHD
jgi:hypothetical protein